MHNNKYIFGSVLLRLDNCRDIDEKIYLEVPPHLLPGAACVSIPFVKVIISNFIGGRNCPDDYLKSTMLYQYSYEFHNDDTYPFNFFSIFDYKDIWINQLRNWMNHPKTEKNANAEEILPKIFYHIEYQYHMIKENRIWIDGEGKAIVQKIHDREMPVTYFYELRDKINKL